MAIKRAFKLLDGKTIPAIAWGNGTGGLQKSGNRAVLGGQVALEAGIRHLDTAQYYETEAETTAAITATGIPRGDVFVTDKGGSERARERGMVSIG